MSNKEPTSRRGAFGRAVGEETRRRLLKAAAEVFGRHGYVSPSIDDIIQQAGVTRPTFYRHFDGKFAIALEYFSEEQAAMLPFWSDLDERAAKDPASVKKWLEKLFASYGVHRHRLRGFIEMGAIEPEFSEQVGEFVADIIESLGSRIAAFKGTSGKGKAAQLHKADAALLVHQILQHASVAGRFLDVDPPLVRESLARAFVAFVERYDPFR